MGIDVKVLGCNIECRSCYENTIKNCGNFPELDFDKVLETLKKNMNLYKASLPSLHGGEPLMLGKRKVEKLLKMIFEERGRTSIQTNGILIDNEWIDMFLKYETSIGVSLDGDTPELNAGRIASEKIIDHILKMIGKMKMSGISVSVISILRKHNAAPDRIKDFIKFLKRLADEFSIYYVRTNPGIAFTPETIETEQLSDLEMGYALMKISDVCFEDQRYKWQPTRDIVEMMAGFTGKSTCNFNPCDVWHTESETPIIANGEFGNCMKNGGAQDGIVNLRSEKKSFSRTEALYQIEIDEGGCKECRWWDYCHGGCPGESEGNDHRRKSRFCESWQMVFSHIQKRMEAMFPSIQIGTGTPLQNFSETTWQKQYMKNPVKKEISEAELKKSGGHGDSHGDRPHGDSNDPVWLKEHPEWGRK